MKLKLPYVFTFVLVIALAFLVKTEFFDTTHAEVINAGISETSTVQTVAGSGTDANHNTITATANKVISKLKAIVKKSGTKKTNTNTPSTGTITYASGGGSSSVSAAPANDDSDSDTSIVTTPATTTPVTTIPNNDAISITNPADLDASAPVDVTEPEPEEPVDISDLADDEFEEIIAVPDLNFIAGILTQKGLEKLEESFVVKEDVRELIENDGELRVIIDYVKRTIERDIPLQPATAESFPLIKADVVGNMSVNGNNIDGSGQTVCVVDTGVSYSHTELGGCGGGQFLAGNCPKTIGGWDFFNNDANPADDNGHGTALAGIVAANGSSYKGVAPGTKIVAIKVTDSSGNGWSSYATAGVNWCVNNASAFNITTILFGLNDGNSYNSASSCDGFTLTNAMANAVSNNITVYAPSGNNGYTNGISYPACGSSAISVAAVEDGSFFTTADNFWTSGNRGSILDMLAPGSVITRLTIPSGTTTSSGTSLATAHAAGADILLRQYNQLKYNQNPTPSQIKNILRLTGVNITDNGSGGSNLTFPRIDLLRAVNYETIAPVVTLVSPANNVKNLGNVNFTYNVTDHHNILNCSLYVNSVLNQTNNNVQKGQNQQFTVNNLNSGSYNWQVKCWDNATFPNQGSSSTWTYNVNYPPTLSQIPNQTIQKNSSNNQVDVSSYISDTDIGDSYTITIVTENTSEVDCSSSSTNLIMNPNNGYSGHTSCTIQVNDGLQNSNSVTVNIYVNAPPVITSTPVTSASVGSAYSYTVTATDAETLTYSLTTNPAGMSINSGTGAISWTPVSGQQGNNNVVVQVSDSYGGSTTQSFTVTVQNNNPVISTAAPTTGNVGVPYSYDVNATDSDGDTLTYALTANPTGMSINSATGLITWTPGTTQRGNHAVTVQVSDGYGGSATQSFNITVPNIDPVLNPISNITVNEGQLVSITPSATDAENDTLTYSFTSPLDASGQWQTTYNDAGTYSTTVTVDDGYGGSDSQVVYITVNNIPAADLEVQYFVKQAPANPTAGNDIILGFALKNVGEVPASNILWVVDSGTTDDHATGTISSLNVSEGQIVMALLRYASPGSYTPRVILDPSYAIPELNESNNIVPLNVVVS